MEEDEEAAHGLGEAPQREGSLLARSGRGQAPAKAMSDLPARRRRRLRALFTFLEALSWCLPAPTSCMDASATPWWRGRQQFAWVNTSYAMVAWLVVTKRGR